MISHSEAVAKVIEDAATARQRENVSRQNTAPLQLILPGDLRVWTQGGPHMVRRKRLDRVERTSAFRLRLIRSPGFHGR
jgi:hypothetical protein